MRNFATIAALAATLVLAPFAAQAHDSVTAGDLTIENARARATPAGARVTGGYMLIENRGAAPDRLVGGSTPAAERVEIHEMAMDDGVMKMRPIPGGLEIPPGGSVELKPGGYHIMLMELKAQLNAGDEVPATLTFEKAGPVEVVLTVVPIGQTGGMHKNGMHK